MKDNICTIPINDAFLPKSGCPICRMKEMLTERSVDFILGGAMMQPDVRVQTNKLGFCKEHFLRMLSTGKRLQNALLLDSHLKYMSEEILNQKPDKKHLESLKQITHSCYICNKIEWGMEHLCETVLSTWQSDNEFRALFGQQEYICLEHYHMLLNKANNKGIAKKYLSDFNASINKVVNNHLDSLQSDIKEFCDMFDYRNKDKATEVSKDCIEKALKFLRGDN